MLKDAVKLFFVAFLILIIFLPSYAKMQDLRQKNESYKDQIVDLKKQNSLLLIEKERLEKDPVYLEKVAREKMGLVKEGEVVYKVMSRVKQDSKDHLKSSRGGPVKTPKASTGPS